MAVELTQFSAFATNALFAKTLTTALNVKIILVTSTPSSRLENPMALLLSLSPSLTNKKMLNRQSKLNKTKVLNTALVITVIMVIMDIMDITVITDTMAAANTSKK
jgi:hypothetical protein